MWIACTRLLVSYRLRQALRPDEGVDGGHARKLLAAEEHRVLVLQQRLVPPVVGVGDELGRGEGRRQEGLWRVGRRGALDLLREPALGAVGLAQAVVGLLRRGGELRPGLRAAVDAVLPEPVEDGGPLREEGLDRLGGADGFLFGREELRQEPAGVLCEAEDEEDLVLGREGLLGVGGGREQRVDAGEELGADGEGRLLDAGGVQAEQGGEEHVEEDGAGRQVGVGRLGGGARDRHAAVEAVREVGGAPLAGHEACAEDRAQVREGRELRGVPRGEDEAGQGEAEVHAALRRGRGEEVRVDLGLGVVVVGEPGVELGDPAVELGVARYELGGRGQGEVIALPLGGSPARAGQSRQQAVDPQVCPSVEGVAKSSWRTRTWSSHLTPWAMRTLYLFLWWDMTGRGMQCSGAWGGQTSMHSLAYSPAPKRYLTINCCLEIG